MQTYAELVVYKGLKLEQADDSLTAFCPHASFALKIKRDEVS